MNAATGRAGATPQQALAGVIAAIGSSGFGDEALHALNDGVLDAASWSVYQLWREREPELHLSASRGVADTTQLCFAAYRAGLYRRDASFDRVRGGGHAAVLGMQADEAPNAEHRDTIYRRHRIAERLSVAALQDDGSLLAVNLYRHEHQSVFDGVARDNLQAIAVPLLATVHRHIAIARPAPRPCPPTLPERRQRLADHCPTLTERELDVCERLLRGWSHDGIASDLGLSLATVKTYRARAFARLGLHFRSQLFARFGAADA